LVTGAARGIGFALVKRAIARGDTVFAVVRKESDKTKFGTNGNVHPILMDLTDTESVEYGFAEVDEWLAGTPLDVVINAAAISVPGAIELTSVEEISQTIDTNFFGSLRVLKASIPRLRGHGGRIILVTSLWGHASGAMLGAYCASKHAIESLADTARRETAGMNLHVVVAEPGVIMTDMYMQSAAQVQALLDRMSVDQKRLYGPLYQRYKKLVSVPSMAMNVENCAAGIEKAAFAMNPRTRYRVGRDSKVVCFLDWLLPDRWMDFVMGMSLNNKPLEEQAARQS
jgi:NAD(P)-dependent dehydrogenase (short-subunit alcohol dehydrogenase family)